MAWINLGERGGSEYVESFLSALERIGGDSLDDKEAEGVLFESMKLLTGLAICLNREPDAVWVAEEMPRLRQGVRAIFTHRKTLLYKYLISIEPLLWGATQDDWYQACIRRSAIQVFIDEIDQDVDHAILNRDFVDECDDEFREAASDAEQLPPSAIPDISLTHWWWTAPGKAG
ncbi:MULTISPECIES: hypothetical protein [unclassified Streptomyces]|uniref:hypothetical protein n=1 Tax=unclassified Streptomyces TaxID=2593676 RepID=UPI0036F07EBD